ncbi:MAG: hypothetical protein UX08_C0010G0009 [Candidatus Collierbacteria bacterium GW2011_GWB1_45_35]|nr:MAG: hypothetical protein UX08_C0010G0009 [Candidatus Collierbacteria bacterium GW2011_GWB1_45_35]
MDLFTFKESPRRLSEYKFSSYGNYLHQFSQSWVNTSEILGLFSATNKNYSYENFVDGGEPDDITRISTLTIDI